MRIPCSHTFNDLITNTYEQTFSCLICSSVLSFHSQTQAPTALNVTLCHHSGVHTQTPTHTPRVMFCGEKGKIEIDLLVRKTWFRLSLKTFNTDSVCAAGLDTDTHAFCLPQSCLPSDRQLGNMLSLPQKVLFSGSSLWDNRARISTSLNVPPSVFSFSVPTDNCNHFNLFTAVLSL